MYRDALALVVISLSRHVLLHAGKYPYTSDCSYKGDRSLHTLNICICAYIILLVHRVILSLQHFNEDNACHLGSQLVDTHLLYLYSVENSCCLAEKNYTYLGWTVTGRLVYVYV